MESTDKLLKLVNEFSKAISFFKKSITFLHTSNKKYSIKFKEDITKITPR